MTGAAPPTRSMWKGAVTFGLVTVPVKLYNATESDYAVRFNMLCKDHLVRINQKIWCPAEQAVIERSATVKGYEYAPDQFVVVTDEDLERVPLKTVKAISVERFTTPADAAATLRFAKQVYYLEPEKVGRKAFFLLREALRRKGVVAICKVLIREREAMAVLEPQEDTLMLTTLHWPDEVRPAGFVEASPEDLAFRPVELEMAERLVDAMSGPLDLSEFRDEYRDALLQLVQAKVDGAEVAQPAAANPSAPLDLMGMLQASVAAARLTEQEEAPRRKRRGKAAA